MQEDYLESINNVKAAMPEGDDKPAILIVSHTRKPKSEERHSGRALMNLLAGSYVLTSVPRSIWIIQSASNDGTDNRVVWTCSKNNDGELGERSSWIRKNGLFEEFKDFNWEEFDGDGVKNFTWQDIVEILKNDAYGAVCGNISKSAAKDKIMKETGISRAQAYRWIDEAIKQQALRFVNGSILL